jgi:hypothetical protein
MSNAKNVLLRLHLLMSRLPVNFRGRVCEECNWSIPTFYRKLRLVDVSNRDGRLVAALSDAEKEIILEMMKEVYDQLGEELQSFVDHKKNYRRNNG